MPPGNLKWMNIWVWTAATAVAGLLLLGCMQPDTLEKSYGDAMHNNVAQQLANPQAGMKEEPPAVGLPPKAAVNEMDRYEKGFKGEAPPPAPYMGITGAK